MACLFSDADVGLVFISDPDGGADRRRHTDRQEGWFQESAEILSNKEFVDQGWLFSIIAP